ncbi:MAG: dicarboxylate/amino acid:cation symporter [Chlamydiia bacterium]
MESYSLKRPAASRIFFAMVLGIFTGFMFGDACRALAPIGNAFVMLLKMTVLPYMVCSLVHGTGSMPPESARKLLSAGLVVVSGAWIIILCVIEGLAGTYPAAHAGGPTPFTTDSVGIAGHLLQVLIPENVFAALANNVVPAIVLFSLLFGAALLRTANKRHLLDFFSGALEVLTRMAQWIGHLAPIGVFALLAVSTGTWTLAEFCKIELYILTSVFGCLILTFWTIPTLCRAITPISPWRLLRELKAPMLLAFTAGTTLIAIPYLIEGLKRVLEPRSSSNERTSFETLVPLVFNIPFGNLFVLLSVFFFAFFFNIPVSFVHHVKVLLLGVLAVFGSPINSISFLIDQIGLPPEATSLFIATYPLTQNFLSLFGSLAIAMVSLTILLASEKRLTPRIPRIILSLGGTAILVTIVAVMLKMSGVVQLAQPCS